MKGCMSEEKCPEGGKHKWTPCVVRDKNKTPFPFLAVLCKKCNAPQLTWEAFVGAAKQKSDRERQAEIAEFLCLNIEEEHLGTPLADEFIMNVPKSN